jgi:hypothetical protein
MTDALRNPFRIGDYELDAMLSEQQARVLWQIHDGDRIVVDTRGATFAWERGGTKPRQYLVQALIDNQWIVSPCSLGPLFGEQHDGRLTVRGLHALSRYRNHHRV